MDRFLSLRFSPGRWRSWRSSNSAAAAFIRWPSRLRHRFGRRRRRRAGDEAPSGRCAGLCLIAPGMILVPGVPLINGIRDAINNNLGLSLARLGSAPAGRGGHRGSACSPRRCSTGIEIPISGTDAAAADSPRRAVLGTGDDRLCFPVQRHAARRLGVRRLRTVQPCAGHDLDAPKSGHRQWNVAWIVGRGFPGPRLRSRVSCAARHVCLSRRGGDGARLVCVPSYHRQPPDYAIGRRQPGVARRSNDVAGCLHDPPHRGNRDWASGPAVIAFDAIARKLILRRQPSREPPAPLIEPLMAREQTDRHERPSNPRCQAEPRRQRFGDFHVEADRRCCVQTFHDYAHVPRSGLREIELGGARAYW